MPQVSETTPEFFDELLGPLPTPSVVIHGNGHGTSAIDRCRRYVAKMPPAIDGEHGSDKMLTVACEIARFGLDGAEAHAVASEYSQRCQPAWSEREIAHKLADARRKVEAAGEFGMRVQFQHDRPHHAASRAVGQTSEQPEPAPMWFEDFAAAHPTMHPEIIEGILREHETANIIAPPKYGKSWLAYGLGLSVCAGIPWLGRYATAQGNVLIWDNELHPPTIASRIPRVAEAMRIKSADYSRRLAVKHLRGKLKDIDWMAAQCAALRGQFKLIIIDAFYRTLPRGCDENANADMMAVYNTIDYLAAEAGSAVVLIHHATKGNQAGKSVTDTGSGAGSIARAADSHIVLRQHQEPGVVVMEAALRSHPPLRPICLGWEFPTWHPRPLLDPTLLFGAKPQRQPGAPAAPGKTTAFERTLGKVREALAKGPLTRNGLRTNTKCSGQTINEALAAMLESGEVVPVEVESRNGIFEGFKLNPDNAGQCRTCPASSNPDGQRLFPIGVSGLICPVSGTAEDEPNCPPSISYPFPPKESEE